ncbi:hypothetical protein NN3_62200 [Nocardia neocaledoniensis NBRC 108232]|nr:hypothetical protein NN3_62200 [Nocardia neocaledoniensis NBRC 108232]
MAHHHRSRPAAADPGQDTARLGRHRRCRLADIRAWERQRPDFEPIRFRRNHLSFHPRLWTRHVASAAASTRNPAICPSKKGDLCLDDKRVPQEHSEPVQTPQTTQREYPGAPTQRPISTVGASHRRAADGRVSAVL